MINSDSSFKQISLCWLFFVICFVFHLMMITSLLSEPLTLDHGKELTGSRTHPVESASIQGILDRFFHDTDRAPRGLDFFSIYQAGYNFKEGHSIYFGVREHREPDLLVVPYFSGFRYLPVYAYSFGVLLTIFSPWTAYWGWVLVIEILFLVNIFLAWNMSVSLHKKLIVAGIWLAFSPYYVELHIGQQSMVTVTLLHFCGYFYFRKKPRLQDAAYMVSVLWKINSLLMLPLWIKLGRFRSIIILFLLIAIFSVPYFLMNEGSYSEFASYFKMKFIAAGPSSFGFWALCIPVWNKLALAFGSQTFSHENLRLTLTIWNMSILAIASIATLLPPKISFIHAFSMWISVYFLTYQYVWEHHYILILPAISLLLTKRYEFKWLIFWFLFAIPSPYILLNNPSIVMLETNWSFWQAITYHGVKTIPMVALFFTLLRKCFEEDRTHDTKQIDYFSLLKRFILRHVF